MIGHQMLSGLAFLHANQINHRDLRDDTVFIHLDGCVKLAYLNTRTFVNCNLSTTIVVLALIALPVDEGLVDPSWAFIAQFLSTEAIWTEFREAKNDVWALGMVILALLNRGHPWAKLSLGQVVVNIQNLPALRQLVSKCAFGAAEEVLHSIFRTADERPACEELKEKPFFQRPSTH